MKKSKAIFAAGCFWGVQKLLGELHGVIGTRVGYTGGIKENPTYEDVCYRNTGHVESVEVEFDEDKIGYEEIVKAFFEIHDFGQEDGQGPDHGEQYKSAVYYLADAQKTTAEKVVAELRAKGFHVATKIFPAGRFWNAEEYHQNYYSKTGGTPYCHFRRKIF